MAHSKPDGEAPSPSIPVLGRSVTAQRRALGAAAVLTGVAVFAALQSPLGVSVAVLLASVGAAGVVFAGGVLLACHVFGHAVECGSRPFCECERCGRPMDDR